MLLRWNLCLILWLLTHVVVCFRLGLSDCRHKSHISWEHQWHGLTDCRHTSLLFVSGLASVNTRLVCTLVSCSLMSQGLVFYCLVCTLLSCSLMSQGLVFYSLVCTLLSLTHVIRKLYKWKCFHDCRIHQTIKH